MSDIKNNNEFKFVNVTEFGKTEEEIRANPEFIKIEDEYSKAGYNFSKLTEFDSGIIISSATFPKDKPENITMIFYIMIFAKSIPKNDPKLK